MEISFVTFCWLHINNSRQQRSYHQLNSLAFSINNLFFFRFPFLSMVEQREGRFRTHLPPRSIDPHAERVCIYTLRRRRSSNPAVNIGPSSFSSIATERSRRHLQDQLSEREGWTAQDVCILQKLLCVRVYLFYQLKEVETQVTQGTISIGYRRKFVERPYGVGRRSRSSIYTILYVYIQFVSRRFESVIKGVDFSRCLFCLSTHLLKSVVTCGSDVTCGCDKGSYRELRGIWVCFLCVRSKMFETNNSCGN